MKFRNLLLALIFLPIIACLDAKAATYDMSEDSVLIIATTDYQVVIQGDKPPVFDTAPQLTGISTENAVYINVKKQAQAHVILNWLTLDTSQDGIAAMQVTTEEDGVATIELNGNNTLKSGDYCAGIEKYGAGELVIVDEDGDRGSLSAFGGLGGAGIGSGSRNDCCGITITSGRIVARGGKYAAGIGGGSHGSVQDVTICADAEVTSEGGKYGAGIGGGSYGSGKSILFSGSCSVIANASYTASAIGGGAYGEGSDIRAIEDAQITAIGGLRTTIYYAGANIGNGGDDKQDGEAYPMDLSELFSSGSVNGIVGEYEP